VDNSVYNSLVHCIYAYKNGFSTRLHKKEAHSATLWFT